MITILYHCSKPYLSNAKHIAYKPEAGQKEGRKNMIKNLLATITKYKDIKAEAEKLAREAEAMKAELLEYMTGKNETVIKCGQYVLTITECTKTGIDEKALREQFPNIASDFEKVTTYKRFTVK